MYTNITKWFVEQTFDFLLGSYVDHIWHAHKAKSRISLVDTIDGKACCPINGMRGTSPHSPISWQTANVKNPCAIETCSYMYRIKRNIYIYWYMYAACTPTMWKLKGSGWFLTLLTWACRFLPFKPRYAQLLSSHSRRMIPVLLSWKSCSCSHAGT